MQQRRGVALPPGSRSVARGSRFGNPWRCPPTSEGRAEAAARYAAWLEGKHDDVRSVRGDLAGPEVRALALDELPGRDLACYCPPEQPCHADVLLALLRDTPGNQEPPVM
ncbi:MAG: DUF4326 domain-containing protein [Gemmatimonadales bacterium]